LCLPYAIQVLILCRYWHNRQANHAIQRMIKKILNC
jgi:hypothetical protein